MLRRLLGPADGKSSDTSAVSIDLKVAAVGEEASLPWEFLGDSCSSSSTAARNDPLIEVCCRFGARCLVPAAGCGCD